MSKNAGEESDAVDSYYKDLKWDSKDKVDRYQRMVAAVTNQSDKRMGFKNSDASQRTEGGTVEAAQQVVNALLNG